MLAPLRTNRQLYLRLLLANNNQQLGKGTKDISFYVRPRNILYGSGFLSTFLRKSIPSVLPNLLETGVNILSDITASKKPIPIKESLKKRGIELVKKVITKQAKKRPNTSNLPPSKRVKQTPKNRKKIKTKIQKDIFSVT